MRREVPEEFLQSKVYVQRKRAQKVVRELYLRDDIVCSSVLCATCQRNAPKDQQGRPTHPVLSATPRSIGSVPRHYVVPDTNVFYHCMDVLERDDVFHDVIVLQTALDELKNKSLPLYNRLRKLVRDLDKRFFVFHNEYHKETNILRARGESINDRNDRAIRYATSWYKAHIASATNGTKNSAPEVLLLTDDRLNREKARSDGILAMSATAYISELPNANILLDMVAEQSRDDVVHTTNFYAPYRSLAILQEGIQKSQLYQGVFNVSTYNYLEASVSTPAHEKPVMILGRENINRAIHGDVVVIEILPESQWRLPTSKILDEDNITKNENADADDSEDVVTSKEQEAMETVRSTDEKVIAQPTAKVVGIGKRNWRPYVGHIDPRIALTGSGSRGTQTIFVLPTDRRVPKIRLRTRQAAELAGQKLVVNIDRWDTGSRYPEGHLVRALGKLESKEAETEALLLEWDVQYRPFPKAVLDCLPPEGDNWVVPDDKLELEKTGRVDLRELLVCSIDPPGCQDIDDALHARLLPNGNTEVGVHIADVSSFVKADTAMDIEAASRGTTVYMVDKRIDMLPHLLGTNLCSLMPYVERYAFSTIWEISTDGSILNVRFTKSVIKSREAFSYQQAQLRIDDINQQDELTQGMRKLLALSKILRAGRLAAGALNLASPEVRIELESETSDPIDVQTKQALETNSLVEEFMLLANISVAQKIRDVYPETAMLRRHGAPPATNFEVLQDILRLRRGMILRVDSSRALADSLDLCVDPSEPFFNTLVRILATRCMLSAEYFSAGSLPATEYRHYGLATDIYTHFTSPIRRYADVIAHRQLSSAINFEPLHPSLENKAKLETICNNINYRHRMAQMAGRASVEYYVGQALKSKSVVEDAFVMKVFSNGFVVFVAKFGIEGVIHLSSLTEMHVDSTFLPETYELVLNPGAAHERRFGIFDKVRVQVSTVLEDSTGKRKVDLKLSAE